MSTRSSSGSTNRMHPYVRIHPGIIKRDKKTGQVSKIHGEAGFGIKTKASKEYSTWSGIKRRCYNKNVLEYKRYGAKGITMCKRWKNSYLSFLTDMGRAPSKSHSIDRINNKENYEPSNCKWSTKHEQSQNRPSIVKLNKYIVQYIRQRKAPAKIIVKELNDICPFQYIYQIKSKTRWSNL